VKEKPSGLEGLARAHCGELGRCVLKKAIQSRHRDVNNDRRLPMRCAEGNNRLVVYAVNSDFHRLRGVLGDGLCKERHLGSGCVANTLRSASFGDCGSLGFSGFMAAV